MNSGNDAYIKIYDVEDSDYIFDECNLKYYKNRPEERIKIGLVRSLIYYYKYPKISIVTEEALYKNGEYKYRADIVVYKDSNREFPYILIELKNNNIGLDDDYIDKLKLYANSFYSNPEVLVLSNGIEHKIFRKDGQLISQIPKYREALYGKYGVKPIKKQIKYSRPKKNPYCISYSLLNRRVNKKYPEINLDLNIDSRYLKAYVSLYEMFLDEEVKYNKHRGAWSGYSIFEDKGVRWSRFSNSSGGQFFGLYRHFLIKTPRGCKRNICFSVSKYTKNIDKPPHTLCVVGGVDGNQALQLQPVATSEFNDSYAKLYHRGYVSRGGGGRLSKDFVIDHMKSHLPDIIEKMKYWLVCWILIL